MGWPAPFRLNGLQTSAEAVPVHTPGSGSDGVTVSPSPAICCNCRDGTSYSLSTGPSSCFHRQVRLIGSITREHRPDDPRILVGERDSRNIGMPPLPQLAEPGASRILFAPGATQSGASAVDHQRAQIPVAALADAEQSDPSST